MSATNDSSVLVIYNSVFSNNVDLGSRTLTAPTNTLTACDHERKLALDEIQQAVREGLVQQRIADQQRFRDAAIGFGKVIGWTLAFVMALYLITRFGEWLEHAFTCIARCEEMEATPKKKGGKQ